MKRIPSNPCPSCKVPITPEEVINQSFWHDDQFKPYHCPHCGGEIVRARAIWPELLYVAAFISSPLIAQHFNHLIEKHYPTGTPNHLMAKALFFAILAGAWFSVWLFQHKSMNKPFWKLAKPQTKKNNEGI